MFRQIVVTVLLSVLLASLARASNDGPVREMQQVIASDSRLSSEQKAALDGVVSGVLTTQPELSKDKRLHARDQLRQYLDQMVPALQSAPEARFALFEDTFGWELQNYAMLPSITEQQRKEMRKAIEAMLAGVRPAIDAVYVDTPEAVRAEVAQRVQARLRSLLNSDKIGNYFYPQFLYPPRQDIHPEKVRDELSRNPSMQAKRDAFAEAVGHGKDGRPDLSDPKVRSFVNRETGTLDVQIEVMISRLSGIGALRPGQFVQMPKDLQERSHALATRSVSESEALIQRNANRAALATRAASRPAATSAPAP